MSKSTVSHSGIKWIPDVGRISIDFCFAFVVSPLVLSL